MTPKPIKYIPQQGPPGEYANVVCTKCEKSVTMVFPGWPSGPDRARSLQPDGGLHLSNHYGYGMWRDQDHDQPANRDIVLCEPCTDRFLLDNQWLERYLSQ